MANVSYFDVRDFIAGQGITLRSAASPQFLQNRLDAVLAYVKRVTGIEYGTDVLVATRRFDGNGYQELEIDPCTSITAVRAMTNGETVYTYVADSDYAAYPLNDTTKTSLKLISDTVLTASEASLSWPGSWPLGEANIEVDATWGECVTMPDDLKEAVILKAALWTLAGDALPTIDGALQGAVKSYDVGAYSVEFFQGGSQNMVATLTGWEATAEEIIKRCTLFRPW